MTEEKLAKLKRKTLELMCQDRQKLLVRYPFTGGCLMRLDLVPVRDCRLRTAATDGTRIFMDIDFCSKLSAGDRIFVLAHELWHCVFMHMLRRRGRDAEIFNYATDMEVNRMLVAEGMRPPSTALLPKREWGDISAEEMYEKLNDALKQEKGRVFDRHIYSDAAGCGGDGKEEGSGSTGVTDQWGEVGFDPDYRVEITKELAERIRENILAVAQQVRRSKGSLPGGIEAIVDASMRPQVRWQEILNQFVTSCYGGSRRWLPPNRRHIHSGLYLQSSRKECLRAVVAIDTSGSTTCDLPQFFSELNGLLNSFGDYELTVIQGDACVADVQKYDSYNPAPTNGKWETSGGGGTSFVPVFDYVREHPEINPSCLIYVTDGYGTAPEAPPPYHVLWLLTEDGVNPAGWGAELRLKKGGRK